MFCNILLWEFLAKSCKLLFILSRKSSFYILLQRINIHLLDAVSTLLLFYIYSLIDLCFICACSLSSLRHRWPKHFAHHDLSCYMSSSSGPWGLHCTSVGAVRLMSSFVCESETETERNTPQCAPQHTS